MIVYLFFSFFWKIKQPKLKTLIANCSVTPITQAV